ncbi:MAG: DUF1700 domain-containing protein [Oscillospiraceae bacterium]|nr:DUF1700 domain-containing protein [Oscillospiraceae bacterium]
MTRNEFLWSLNNALAGLPQSEVKRVTEYYDELFNEAMEEGKTEEEVCAGLGSPNDIAGRVRAELAFIRAEQQPTPKSMNAVLLVLLGLFALPVGLPLAIAALAVLFAMYVTVFALIIAGGAVMFALGVSGLALIAGGVAVIIGGAPLFGIGMIGAAFILMGISILGGVASYHITHVMLRGVVKLSRSIYDWAVSHTKKGGVSVEKDR